MKSHRAVVTLSSPVVEVVTHLLSASIAGGAVCAAASV
jgi:hypothetical protein